MYSFLDNKDPNADMGPVIVQLCVAMMVISGISVTLRFVARAIARLPLLADDWMVLIGMIFSWGTTIIHIVAVNYGNYARHIVPKVTPMTEIVIFLKCLYAVQITYLFSIAFTKFSILFFYRRIFSVPQTKIPFYVLFGITIAWVIGNLLPGIFSCNPVYGFWDKTVEPTCIDTDNYFLGVAIPNVVTDVALLVFPIPLIWKLSISMAQKIGLLLLFGIGGFIIIASSLRLSAVLAVGHNKDVTWVLVPLGIWNVLEMNIAIVLANLPSVRPLLRLVMGKPAVPTSKRYNKNTANSSRGLFSQQGRSDMKPSMLSYSRMNEVRSTESMDQELGYLNYPPNSIHMRSDIRVT